VTKLDYGESEILITLICVFFVPVRFSLSRWMAISRSSSLRNRASLGVEGKQTKNTAPNCRNNSTFSLSSVTVDAAARQYQSGQGAIESVDRIYCVNQRQGVGHLHETVKNNEGSSQARG
jgi:hypothetical protein